MASLAPVFDYQPLDNSGNIVPGGKLWTYESGTTTLKPVFKNQAGTVEHEDPIILDASGRIPGGALWLGSGEYTIRLTTAADAELWTRDDVSAPESAGSAAALEASLRDTATPTTKGAGQIGTKSTSTGAVATTQHEVNERTLSVLTFMTDAQRTDVLSRTAALDVTTALQAAADAAKASGARLIGCPGVAKITSTLVLECSGDLSELTIRANGASFSPAVRLGPNTAGQYLFNADISLPFVTNTAKSGAGWGGFSNAIGVDVANVYQSRIVVPYIYNFGVGLAVGGYSVGCVYNQFSIGVLWGNKVNCKVYPKDGSGWANENVFIGGRYAHDSAEGAANAGCRHIWLCNPNSSTGDSPNQNVFIKPSVEGNETEFHVDIQGAWNRLISPRFENSVPCRVNFNATYAGETTANLIDGGYDSSGLTYTFSGAGTSTNNQRIGAKAENALDFSGSGVNVVNRTSSSSANPHFQGFEASQTALGKTSASTDWVYRIHGGGISVKSAASSHARLEMNSDGGLYLGSGSIAPTAKMTGGDGFISPLAHMLPTDNTYSCGGASNRWTVIYAASGSINTSDGRAKEQVRELADSERAVAVRLKGLIRAFKFKDAVAAKGDGARIHVGVVAQDVIAAFAAEGLDAHKYALLCYDKWDASEEEVVVEGKLKKVKREAGESYGIRYEELLAFVLGAL
jgi:hypothetical protein